MLLLLLFALGLRLAALHVYGAEALQGDEGYYVQQARAIAGGFGHPGSVRPPLYPAFLAGIFQLVGESLLRARLVQIGLSLVTIVLVQRVAARRFGARAGWWAGLVCAVAPELVHYPHFFWSEGFAAFLLAVWTAVLDAFDREARAGGGRSGRALFWAAAAGLVLGLCVLTRETWLYVGLAVALLLALRRPRAPRSLLAPLALILAMFATILPWTIRNQKVHGRFVLVSTNRWLPIAYGNLYSRDNWLFGRRADAYGKSAPALRDEFAAQQYWRGVALEAIRSEQPGWIGKKLVRTTAAAFCPRTQAVRQLTRGHWQPSRRVALLVAIYDIGLALALWVVAAAALWLVPDPGLKPSVLLAILVPWAIYVIANAEPRFFVPIQPLLAVYAGALLAGAAGRAAPRWRRIGAGLSVAVVLLVPLPFTVRTFEKLAQALERAG